MTTFLIQGTYSASATASMVKHPQDRATVVRSMVEKAGGKLHGFWLAFGDQDIVVIAEMPDNVSVAAISMAVGASGTMSTYKSTQLLSSDEAVSAMKQASEISYQPPK